MSLIAPNDYNELDAELEKLKSKDPRIDRFFVSKEKCSFYTVEDSEIIKKGLTQNIQNEGTSIFFPIGFKGVELKSVLGDDITEEMLSTAQLDPKLKEQFINIEQDIKSLRQGLTPQTILQSFNGQGLFSYMNAFLRNQRLENLRIFREYLFCLKGCFMEIAKVASITTAFGGLSFSSNDDLRKWTESTNKFGLLPSFVPVTNNEELANYYIGLEQEKIRGQQGKSVVKLYFKATENTEEFNDYLTKFNFADSCGIFYPISINTIYNNEQELLFPPFYPFKITHVDLKEEGYSIYISVPKLICFTPFKNSVHKFLMMDSSPGWSKEFVEKACELVEKGLSNDLTICIC